MAGIDKSKFVDEKPIVKAFEDINEAIKETSKYFDKLVTDAGELQKSLKDIKGFEALIRAQKEYTALQADAVKSQKTAIDLQNKEAKLRETTAKAILAEKQALSLENKEAVIAERAAKKKATDMAKEISLYAQLSKAHVSARNSAKDLAVQYGTNSKQYKAAADEANKLDKQLKKIDSGLGQSNRFVGQYQKAWSGIVNVYTAVAAAAGAAIKYIVDLNVKFNKASASLRAITGASKEDMKFFEAQAKSMGKTWGIAADEMLKSFERVGSIRPELLKTKEALVEVTQSAIVLSQASGGVLDLAGATEALGAGMNQFNLGAKDSERIINALAAGSQIGSAEVASLAESFKNVGAVASNANMDLEDTVAALEVLGEKSLYGAEAGTKLRGTILKLQEAGKGFASGKFNLKDALTETKAQLDAIASPIEKATYLQKMFGIENQTAGIIMLQNIDKLEQYSKGVRDTTVAFEQQKIQMDTISGEWARLGSTWDSILTSGWFSESIKWVIKFGRELLDSGFGFKQYFQTAQDVADETANAWLTTLGKLPIEEQTKKLAEGIKAVKEALGRGENIDANNILLGVYTDKLNAANAAVEEHNKIALIRWELSHKTVAELLLENAENEKNLKSIEAMVGVYGGYDVVRSKQIADIKLNIKAINEEVKAREKLTSSGGGGGKVGLSEDQIKKNLEAAKKYKAESDKIADAFFDEWERVELINIKKSEDAKEQKLKDEKAYQEASLKQQEDYLDEAMRVEQIRIDKEAEQAQYIADLKQGLREDAVAVGKDLVDTMFSIQQNNYDKEIKLIEDRYTKELDNANLTEQQRSALEAQRDAEILRVEQKKRESQRKQFIVNKAIALAEIAISTAQGIAKTLAAIPMPAALPFTIAAGLIGAAQAAVVLAQPMPAFDKGTDNAPSTPFLVGEKGAEFVTHKGETQLVDKPTVMSNMGGAVVTSRIETAKILQKNARETMWSANNKGKQLDNTAAILAAQNETNRLLKKRESIKIYNDSNINSRAQIGHNTMINRFAK